TDNNTHHRPPTTQPEDTVDAPSNCGPSGPD
ncbi:unnamed protein product, partial [marine sediment metagenome]